MFLWEGVWMVYGNLTVSHVICDAFSSVDERCRSSRVLCVCKSHTVMCRVFVRPLQWNYQSCHDHDNHNNGHDRYYTRYDPWWCTCWPRMIQLCDVPWPQTSPFSPFAWGIVIYIVFTLSVWTAVTVYMSCSFRCEELLAIIMSCRRENMLFTHGAEWWLTTC